MKAKEILELFIGGDLHNENTCKVEVDNYTDLDWLIGAHDARDVVIPNGEYVVYYNPIVDYGDNVKVKPEYTFHDADGNEIYLIKIED